MRIVTFLILILITLPAVAGPDSFHRFTLFMHADPGEGAAQCFYVPEGATEPQLKRKASEDHKNGVFTCLFRTDEYDSTQNMQRCSVLSREGQNQPLGAICKSAFVQPGTPTLWVQMRMSLEKAQSLRCRFECQ